jgi:hypothetical protein
VGQASISGGETSSHLRMPGIHHGQRDPVGQVTTHVDESGASQNLYRNITDSRHKCVVDSQSEDGTGITTIPRETQWPFETTDTRIASDMRTTTEPVLEPTSYSRVHVSFQSTDPTVPISEP